MKLRIFGLILLFTILIIPTGCENYKSQLDELQSQYDKILQENQSLQGELQEARDELELYKNTGIKVYSGIQPGVVKNELGGEVLLVNKAMTHNPTWSELMSFRNRILQTPGYMVFCCAAASLNWCTIMQRMRE